MGQSPRVNILIVNYNYENFLKDSINSALNQTYDNTLITIVDDCSSDNSWEKIDELLFKGHDYDKKEEEFGEIKTRDNIIAIRLKENGGPSLARNIGISCTIEDSDFYQILDADDIMYNNKVESLLSCFATSDIGVSYGDCDLYNKETGTLVREFREPYSYNKLLQECIVHSGAMIKKEALVESRDDFGFYDVNMRTCEDYDLWIRISEKFMIVHMPQPLTRVTIHNQNSTSSVDKSIWEQNWARIGRKIQSRHGKQ